MSLEDKAQEHEAQIWSINNARREVIVFTPGDAGYGQELCENCGDDVHPVRRSYGFNRCTPCASAAERRR